MRNISLQMLPRHTHKLRGFGTPPSLDRKSTSKTHVSFSEHHSYHQKLQAQQPPTCLTLTTPVCAATQFGLPANQIPASGRMVWTSRYATAPISVLAAFKSATSVAKLKARTRALARVRLGGVMIGQGLQWQTTRVHTRTEMIESARAGVKQLFVSRAGVTLVSMIRAIFNSAETRTLGTASEPRSPSCPRTDLRPTTETRRHTVVHQDNTMLDDMLTDSQTARRK